MESMCWLMLRKMPRHNHTSNYALFFRSFQPHVPYLSSLSHSYIILIPASPFLSPHAYFLHPSPLISPTCILLSNLPHSLFLHNTSLVSYITSLTPISSSFIYYPTIHQLLPYITHSLFQSLSPLIPSPFVSFVNPHHPSPSLSILLLSIPHQSSPSPFAFIDSLEWLLLSWAIFVFMLIQA